LIINYSKEKLLVKKDYIAINIIDIGKDLLESSKKYNVGPVFFRLTL